MKILLLGRDGQVGRELRRTLLPFGDVRALGRSEADLASLDELVSVLEAEAPDLIVNAAAYTAVDKAEADETAAFRVNADAVGAIARFARRKNATLVHYSTDYVFDGSKSGAYVEADDAAPLNAYGRSKRAGELAILESGCDALIFRTSWVYSAHGNNFVKTILRLAKQRDRLTVVADQFGAPTAAELIADVTALAIAAHRRGGLPGGLYHLSATGSTTWQGLARYVVEAAARCGIALTLGADDILPIPTEQYPLPAKRPKNSMLDTHALASSLGLKLPDWTLHVERVLDQLSEREVTA